MKIKSMVTCWLFRMIWVRPCGYEDGAPGTKGSIGRCCQFALVQNHSVLPGPHVPTPPRGLLTVTCGPRALCMHLPKDKNRRGHRKGFLLPFTPKWSPKENAVFPEILATANWIREEGLQSLWPRYFSSLPLASSEMLYLWPWPRAFLAQFHNFFKKGKKKKKPSSCPHPSSLWTQGSFPALAAAVLR